MFPLINCFHDSFLCSVNCPAEISLAALFSYCWLRSHLSKAKRIVILRYLSANIFGKGPDQIFRHHEWVFVHTKEGIRPDGPKDADCQKDARRCSAGMECSLPPGRDWWFPIPRPETHVGQLADSVRSTAFCFAGNGRMGEHRDGAPIRSPCAKPFNGTREANWLNFQWWCPKYVPSGK